MEEDREPGKAKPRSGSKSLDIGEYIGTRAGGWWALLVPGGTSSLPQKPPSGLHPPPAVGSTPDTNGTQWGAESVRVPLRGAGAQRIRSAVCVCQILPAHTVHDTPFLLSIVHIISSERMSIRQSGSPNVRWGVGCLLGQVIPRLQRLHK